MMEQVLGHSQRELIGHYLEQISFALLLLLGTILAFEQREPTLTSAYFVLTNVEMVALLVILCWLATRLAAGSLPRLPQALLIPLLAWLAWLSLSTLLAPVQQDKALLFLLRILAGIALFMITFDLTRRSGRRMKMAAALVLGASLVAIFGMVEGFGPPAAVAWLDQFKEAPTRVGGVLRVSATLSYATITAMVLEMFMPLLLALWLMARRRVWQILIPAGGLLILAAHVLTLSRGGIISLLAAFLIMAFAGWRRGHRRLVAAALGSVFVLLLLFAMVLGFNPMVRLRLTTETEQTWYQARYEIPPTIEGRSGQLLSVPVQVTNDGLRRWTPDGEHFFALAYHLYAFDGEPVTFDGERTFLPRAVEPGETIPLQGQVRLPNEPGEYKLNWDMVQEGVNWFSWEDVPSASSTLIVRPGKLETKGGAAISTPPSDVRITRPTPERFDLWRAALEMTADHPLFGVGPDNFRWRYGDYAGLAEWNTGIHANNLYLEWLSGTGIPGLVFFLWFSIRLWQAGYRRLRGQKHQRTWLITLGLVAGLATWYIHGFFDYFYEFTPTYMAFWMLAGLLTAVPLRR